jgi:benzoyl-CoA reductase subunit B
MPTAAYIGEVHDRAKRAMDAWFREIETAAAADRKTAAVMVSGAPIELLRAFDVVPIFPEVNALQLAIRKKSLPMILRAEQEGYASDSCAYVKADVGMTFAGVAARPSLVLCNYVGCNVYVKWFEHTSALTGAPLVMLDVPFARTSAPAAHDVAYVVHELEELVATLERLTGRRLDMDRLREVCALSARAEAAWSRCKELCKHRPAPFDAYFDSINLMGPANCLRGTEAGAEVLEAAAAAYEALAAEGRGPLAEERFRIVVEGPPPYPAYRSFRDLFARWGAVAVASTYSCVGGLWEFGYRHDPARPLESIAEHMLLENLTNRSLEDRGARIARYLRDWGADALVIHGVKSCRLFSAGQGDVRERITRDDGFPVLMLESDLEDPRYYAEAQMKNRIDAFFESLEHRRALAGGGTAGEARS